MKNRIDVNNSNLRRPNRSEKGPIVIAPIIAPTRTAETTHPCCQEFSDNCFSMNRIAPEIDPVSYPKSKPPKAAKK